MIGMSMQERIKDHALTREETYLVGLMLGLAHLRQKENEKFTAHTFLNDPATPEEIELEQKCRAFSDAENFKENEVYWHEVENAPITAHHVRYMFLAIQKECIRKNYSAKDFGGILFEKLMAYDVPMHDHIEMRERMAELKKIQEKWEADSIVSRLFTEPEAFRLTKGTGNFASMDRKRFYRQNASPKHARMSQHRNFRRKM